MQDRISAFAIAALAGAALSFAPARAVAEPAQQQASPARESWNGMLDKLKDLPDRILARLPEEERNDPLLRREVEELALGALASSSISALAADVDHPIFLPLSGLVFGIGQPNADTIYKTALVDPTGIYRIRGKRGTVRMAYIAQHGPTAGDPVASRPRAPGPSMGQLDLNKLGTDADGRFNLVVSAQRPAGYGGDWWRLDPGASKLMARLVSSDWASETEPTLSIERLDRPVYRSRPEATELAAKLQRVWQTANFLGPLLVADPSRLRQEGYINRLKAHTNDRGLLAGQRYYKGAYDLDDDEALILETRVPEGCHYWSVILTNHIYVTTDWANNQSSLNDSQARLDKDGVLRIVISPKDPGVPNWIDTAGYPRGLIQGRWFGCEAAPIPTMRKVPLDKVRKALPADTPSVSPAERERIVRERRSALQQRSYW